MCEKLWSLCMVFLVLRGCTPQVLFEEFNDDIFYEIVGIFEEDASSQTKAFNESMRNANIGDLRMKPYMLKPYRTDSYSVWRELCANTALKPIIVLGPQNPFSDGAVMNQCALANIPHIQSTWQPIDPDMEIIQLEEPGLEEPQPVVEEESNEEPIFKNISINFYPNSDEVSLAYSQLLKYYNWENFAVLYEDDFGLMRIQKILANHTEKFPVTVRRLDPNGQNHKVFKELVTYQESRILVDCQADRIKNYMAEADALKMVNHYQHYIFTSLDAGTVAEDLTKFQSNITWLSITMYDQLTDPQHFLTNRVGRWTSDYPSLISKPVTSLKTEALLMDDIANHVMKALGTVKQITPLEAPTYSPCEGQGEPWSLGALLQEKLLTTQTTGVTGNIEFNDSGKRVNYTLYVNEIHVSKRETIGNWDSAKGNLQENRTSSNGAGQQTSKHFIVISRKAKPFFYDKENNTNDENKEEEDDGEKYEGFSVDLIKDIFHILKNEMGYNYTYAFSEVEHKSIGTYNPKTKKWGGIFGDVLDKKADLAVCDITITEERKKAVDFSVPIMSMGISILFTKEHKVAPGIFSFLNPYSLEVWLYTATAYCVVSIILFVCSRISPADWENPQPCDKDPEELENIWNFKNCAWLTMGSIMTQGCDILPKAVGSRWVCGMWWFFAMIVCQTYIAQLAASMTSALENEPVNSVEDLAKQNRILYGALQGGSTLEFFKNSKDKMYQRLYENMMSNPVVLVNDVDEGEKRVLNGKNRYAFFMESSTIEYKLKRNCNLKQVGNELDSKDYGIAMPANSPFRSQINRAILKLKERTQLDAIKKKWWETKYGAQDCEEETDKGDVEGDLEIENLIGLFLVLIIGLIICIFIAAAEFMNEVRNIVVREQVSHKEAFIQELKASLNFYQLEKPVLRNPSRAPSMESSTKSDEMQLTKAAAITSFLDMEKCPQ